MGNCMPASENKAPQHTQISAPEGQKLRKDSVPDLSEEAGSVVHFENEYEPSKSAGDAYRLTDKVANSGSNVLPYVNGLAYSTNDKNNSTWTKYVAQSKPTGDSCLENDTGSSFGENWDPTLFDHRDSPGVLKPFRCGDDNINRRRRVQTKYVLMGARPNDYNLEHWPSRESICGRSEKRSKLQVLSSSILGFSRLRQDLPDSMEWYRNGELECTKPNMNDFLIKGKQRPCQQRDDLSNNELDREKNSTDSSRRHKAADHEGWLRYTMFLHQDRLDVAKFCAQFRKAKHTFLSLETKTGCEIRLSQGLFVHKGKYVRTVVIDGPSRKHILRCYSCLPTLLTGPMILDCERPSMSEPRTVEKPIDSVTVSEKITPFQSTALMV